MEDPQALWGTSAAASGIQQAPQAAGSRRSRTQKKTAKAREAKQYATQQALTEAAAAQERATQGAADDARFLSVKKNLLIAACLSALVLVCILWRGGGGGSGAYIGGETGAAGAPTIVCASPLLRLTCEISGCGVLPLLLPPTNSCCIGQETLRSTASRNKTCHQQWACH